MEDMNPIEGAQLQGHHRTVNWARRLRF